MVTKLKHSAIPAAEKNINSMPARPGTQEIFEKTYPERDGENDVLYLCMHLIAFDFTTEQVV